MSHTSPGMNGPCLSRVVPGSFTCKGKASIDIGSIQASPPMTTFAKVLGDGVPFPPTFFTLFACLLIFISF